MNLVNLQDLKLIYRKKLVVFLYTNNNQRDGENNPIYYIKYNRISTTKLNQGGENPIL